MRSRSTAFRHSSCPRGSRSRRLKPGKRCLPTLALTSGTEARRLTTAPARIMSSFLTRNASRTSAHIIPRPSMSWRTGLARNTGSTALAITAVRQPRLRIRRSSSGSGLTFHVCRTRHPYDPKDQASYIQSWIKPTALTFSPFGMIQFARHRHNAAAAPGGP